MSKEIVELIDQFPIDTNEADSARLIAGITNKKNWRLYIGSDATSPLRRFLQSHADGVAALGVSTRVPYKSFAAFLGEVRWRGIFYRNGAGLYLQRGPNIVPMLFIDADVADRWVYPQNYHHRGDS